MAVQLELFSPDRMALAEGWERVEALDLAGAREVFAEVARRWPEATEAREALDLLEEAARRLGDLDALPREERLARLWSARQAFPEDGPSARLRRALLERLLVELEAAGGDRTAEPCAGEVLLELGRPHEAERWLAAALKAGGGDTRLLRLHGDALWRLERRREARHQWLLALVEPAPDGDTAGAAALPDPELVAVVEAVGVERAPLEAWFRGLTWLLRAGELPERDSPALEVHRLVAAAEAARRAGDLDAAVRARARLGELAPEVFARYMDRLGGG